MRKKERRRRAKNKADLERKLLLAAKYSSPSGKAKPYKHRYFDGTLTHEVEKDHRAFNIGYVLGASSLTPDDWVTRDVFVTKCERVVAVGEPRYSFSNKAPTCLTCVAPKLRLPSWDELRRAMGWPR